MADLFEHVSADRRAWLLLAGPGVAVAACLGLPGVAAGADTRFAGCDKPFDPYAQSATTLASCGVKTFPRTGTASTADGGTEYNYNVHGHTVSFKMPPRGFNPRTASADELALYGIPRRPSDTNRQTKWDAAVSKLTFDKPPPFVALVPEKAQTDSVSDIWSGYAALAGSDLFHQVGGEYVEPEALPTACPVNAAVFWVGIGGVFTHNLAQDGTAINTPGVGQHQAWKEVTSPSAGFPIMPVATYATPGQNFKAETTWNGRGIGPGTFQFVLYNVYTQHISVVTVNWPIVDDHSAEFIAERPTSGSGLTDALTNFGQLNWNAALTNGTPFNTIPGAGNTRFVMENNQSQVLAYPTELVGPSGQHSDVWKRCG